MTKSIKKYLQSLTKEQLTEVVMEMYKNIKPAKEYLDFYINPNEKKMLEKYRKIIVNEFFPNTKSFNPKTRFAVAKKAIADFKALKPSPQLLADLMLTLPEMACKFTHDFGDMWEQYYTSSEKNFEKALEYLQKNNLLDSFKLRSQDCVKWASICGWGFSDSIGEIYYRFYHD